MHSEIRETCGNRGLRFNGRQYHGGHGILMVSFNQSDVIAENM